MIRAFYYLLVWPFATALRLLFDGFAVCVGAKWKGSGGADSHTRWRRS